MNILFLYHSCMLVVSQVQTEKDGNVNALQAQTAISIGMNGAPSWNTLSKSHIPSIIWTVVKYRQPATSWRILNYEVNVSLLSLAGASSCHYSLKTVEVYLLGFFVVHRPVVCMYAMLVHIQEYFILASKTRPYVFGTKNLFGKWKY